MTTSCLSLQKRDPTTRATLYLALTATDGEGYPLCIRRHHLFEKTDHLPTKPLGLAYPDGCRMGMDT